MKLNLLKYIPYGASPVAQWERTCLSMQEMWIQPLGLEDPLEKEMATRSSILAWKIPRTEEPEEPGRLRSRGAVKSQAQLNVHTQTDTHRHTERDRDCRSNGQVPKRSHVRTHPPGRRPFLL